MAYYVNYKPNKFGAKKQVYNGIRYDSGREAQKAAELDLLLKAGEIKKWERQVKIPINVYYAEHLEPVLCDTDGEELKDQGARFFHICNYYIDFKIYHKDGSIELLEVKGYETPAWKLKWKLCEAIYKDHPKIFLTVEK